MQCIGQLCLLYSNHQENPITDPITEMEIAYTSGTSLPFRDRVSAFSIERTLFTEKLLKKQQLDKASFESHRQMSRH